MPRREIGSHRGFYFPDHPGLSRKYLHREHLHRKYLHVEAEQNHIPVLHHVILSLQPHKALVLGGAVAAAVQQIPVVDHLGPDKAPLKIAVDFSGCLGRLGALGDGPGPGLLLAGGQIAEKSPLRR